MRFSTITKSVTACVVATVAWFVLSSPQAQAAPTEGKAEVRKVVGTASYSDPGASQWQAVKVGTLLRTGSSIKTDANSYVELWLDKNGPATRVNENTLLKIDSLTLQKAGGETAIETKLDLKTGSIMGKVNKLAAASKYEVKTATGVAGIRGTTYWIFADGRIYCESGLIQITVNGVTYDVGPGQVYVPGGNPPVRNADPADIQVIQDWLNTGAVKQEGDGTVQLDSTGKPLTGGVGTSATQ